MPVEIRELIIRTDIRTGETSSVGDVSKKDLRELRKLILEECKRLLSDSIKKKSYKR
jgi:hypothetical protein